MFCFRRGNQTTADLFVTPLFTNPHRANSKGGRKLRIGCQVGGCCLILTSGLAEFYRGAFRSATTLCTLSMCASQLSA